MKNIMDCFKNLDQEDKLLEIEKNQRIKSL